MTTQPNDGGPAFACAMPACPPSHDFEWQPGMSLRDWFAGMAMQGIITGMFANANNMSWTVEGNVVAAYQYADAILKEKGRRDERPNT